VATKSCPPTKPTLLEGKGMIDNLDTLDKALLDRVNTTQCLSIRDVIRPFLLERSESVLRTRIRYLELHNLIKTAKTRHGKVQCSPMNADHLEQQGQFDQAYQDQAAAEVLIEAAETARREEYEAAARARKGT